MQKLLGLIALIILLSCNEKTQTPKEGIWRATLKIQDSKEIPFLFEYRSDNTLVIYNADEKIIVVNVVIEGDSIIIQTPVFEGVLKGRIISEKLIRGDFIKPSLDRVVPFVMEHGNADRFIFSNDPLVNISGNWETVFSPNSKEERYIAKGIFNQIDNRVFGTFRTTTGDYRYLEGVVDGDSLKISTFDGAHAFLFEAKVSDSTMTGVFYSGNHWQEPFFARRNQNYELPEADSLTYLKEGFDGFEFSFPNIEGEIISLHDEYYKNKVVIVQIMGTWCPNCLDETKYYTQYYNNHKNEDLEFVALAFEYAPTKEKAIAGIKRLKNVVGVPYPILLAQYGTSNKKKANEKLPMLNHVLSYPTTIFIDKKGKVRKIHTGFNGPATGKKYVEFKIKFESFVDELLKE
ncbi:MAG: TlpA family protein disulfide reductase [Bacteroidetes bacterium]|nr:TlpA family protein disulfide reductase [Bacteroidota bacterium]